MSALRFLADEDLRYEIVLAVRRMEAAIEISTVQDRGLSGATDMAVLRFALENDLIVVSHDVDTMKGLVEEQIRRGTVLPGLLLVPQNRPTRPVAESLLLIWSASQADDWRNSIVYLPLV